MKVLIAILIAVGVIFVAWKLYDRWEETNREKELQQARVSAQLDPRSLSGMDQRLEPSLDQARQGGAKALREWLDKNSRSPFLQDPRLASIELDYAVLLSAENPIEARKIFRRVKERIPTDSPLYPRIQQLQKTFE